MFDLSVELKKFDYREVEVSFNDLFPNFDLVGVRDMFSKLKDANPHKTVYNVMKVLASGGYRVVLEEQGFWDSKFTSYSGHCHQSTPILGLVLYALGFEVSYLECFRIRDHFFRTGVIDKVPSSEETNPEMKPEFISINRIPYCCLEIMIKGVPYYISGKHLALKEESAVALLTPICYRDYVGVFRHQNSGLKSGIYLNNVIPENNLSKSNFSRRIVWIKQTFKDEEPELFCTFLRMKLI